MLEASRYYTSNRSEGTILSYKDQSASQDILSSAGEVDITSHLCIDTLCYYAKQCELNIFIVLFIFLISILFKNNLLNEQFKI